MLKEYVVQLLERAYPGPMGTAQGLIDEHGISVFLQQQKVQQQLHRSWLPHVGGLADPAALQLERRWNSNFSHRWYLRRFLVELHRAITADNLGEMARIHTMLVTITPKQQAELKLFLPDYKRYLRWQAQFCRAQYQIAFQQLS